MSVKTVDFTHSKAPTHFAESLVNTGFAVLTNHPISHDLIFNTYKDWAGFFASDEKHRYRFKEKEQAGYFPMDVSETAKGYNVKDVKEFYSHYDWAPCPQKVSTNTQRLFKDLLSFAKTLLSWIEEETPARIRTAFSEPLSHMIKESRYNMMRILHYPPLTGEEESGAVRAAPHEDINLITVLPASTAPGLQVKDTTGEWVSIHSDPGALIVNTGDMLALATQGYYKATTHQVINPVGEDAKKSRYSMPFFLHPRADVRLSPDKTAGEYLNERLYELGLKS